MFKNFFERILVKLKILITLENFTELFSADLDKKLRILKILPTIEFVEWSLYDFFLNIALATTFIQNFAGRPHSKIQIIHYSKIQGFWVHISES